jgi:alpha-tubulin suppressor-like RCC1 family protein
VEEIIVRYYHVTNLTHFIDGQLCHGDTTNKMVPTAVRSDIPLGDIGHVVCGQHHIIVLNTKGQIFVGGWNGYVTCCDQI